MLVGRSMQCSCHSVADLLARWAKSGSEIRIIRGVIRCCRYADQVRWEDDSGSGLNDERTPSCQLSDKQTEFEDNVVSGYGFGLHSSLQLVIWREYEDTKVIRQDRSLKSL